MNDSMGTVREVAQQQAWLLVQDLKKRNKTVEPGTAFDLEIYIQHTIKAAVECRRKHRRALASADAAAAPAPAPAPADGDQAVSNAAAFSKEQELELKAADDADNEHFNRLLQQNMTMMPLVFKVRCVIIQSSESSSSSGGSGGSGGSSNSSSSSSSSVQVDITSCSAEYASREQMQRAMQDNKVTHTATTAATTVTLMAYAGHTQAQLRRNSGCRKRVPAARQRPQSASVSGQLRAKVFEFTRSESASAGGDSEHEGCSAAQHRRYALESAFADLKLRVCSALSPLHSDA
jgi:hypothetical protein